MALARRALAAQAQISNVTDFFAQVGAATSHPDAMDFTFGNPHEMPLSGLVDSMRRHVEPHSEDWFAYKANEDVARAAVAEGLTSELDASVDPADIAMTQGAFGAISLALHLLTDVGDEVITPVPGWFCYAPMLHAAALTPVPVPLADETFELDIDAIAEAITPRTRIVVVNSPANPTGRVYHRAQLTRLASVLDEASTRIGRRIWILSDEPYRRIRFAGVGFTSPASVYPWTVIDYSYGKVLLAPGQRLGYLALSPLLPKDERVALRDAFVPVQLAIGWGFPNALMQYAAPDLEHVGIDLVELERKRDAMHGALAAAGYRMTLPEGTFYLWGRAPGGDGDAFAKRLAARDVYVMSGSLFDRPQHFRISLTATRETIDRALPAFIEAAG